ncbi:MAG: serine/threonine protein kinase [Myxococcaceae bacterium]|nr:MAG: serine/threonine protein kinase [Myxococcaceae bacterium]
MNARLERGAVIDGYTLEERIHQGSMASLWRVSSPGQPPLVMKMPLLREGDDPTAMVGFEVEQMIMPILQGPHVPLFIASGDFSAQPYIVMEHIRGDSLRGCLERTPLDTEEVARIGAQIATALHSLHRQHVIHLDLKPSNVMFRDTGEAVLIDFGFSRHDRLPDLLAEQFRLPMGTAPYISPEQVLRIRNDPRSDIFALGALLYHLVTGERAFGFPTSITGLRKRLFRDPVPPRARNPTCPAWLQEIILRCLEPDPRERYQSAAQALLALRNPGQVPLTERARKLRQDGMMTVTRRWMRTLGAAHAESWQSTAVQIARSPVVVVALDLLGSTDTLLNGIRTTGERVLSMHPGARLACVTVLRTSRLAVDVTVDEEGRNLRVLRLVELKDWARPLGLEEGRLTYHVLEGPDPASVLLDFVRENRVDHVVIGARGASPLRRYLGSVSAHVVAESPCTVTVVKVPQVEEEDETEAEAS